MFVAVGVLGLAWLLGLPRWLGELGALAGIGSYVLAVGAQPSVIRAGIAGALGSLAWLSARQRDRWHFLLVGALLLLAWSPYTLLDAGFQLSFAAVAAIFLAVPRVAALPRGLPGAARARRRRRDLARVRGRRPRRSSWLQFGRIPLYSVPANALAAPVVAPLLGLSLRGRAREPGLAGGGGDDRLGERLARRLPRRLRALRRRAARRDRLVGRGLGALLLVASLARLAARPARRAASAEGADYACRRWRTSSRRPTCSPAATARRSSAPSTACATASARTRSSGSRRATRPATTRSRRATRWASSRRRPARARRRGRALEGGRREGGRRVPGRARARHRARARRRGDPEGLAAREGVREGGPAPRLRGARSASCRSGSPSSSPATASRRPPRPAARSSSSSARTSHELASEIDKLSLYAGHDEIGERRGRAARRRARGRAAVRPHRRVGQARRRRRPRRLRVDPRALDPLALGRGPRCSSAGSPRTSAASRRASRLDAEGVRAARRRRRS